MILLMQFLVGMKLPATVIASLLGVSERTVWRRMDEFALFIRSQYSQISETLDGEVRSMLDIG